LHCEFQAKVEKSLVKTDFATGMPKVNLPDQMVKRWGFQRAVVISSGIGGVFGAIIIGLLERM
jgi:hypothetical protein